MTTKIYSEALTSCVAVYNSNEFSLIPIPYGEKGPKLRNWQQLEIDPNRIDTNDPNQNIGVVLGNKSGSLVDIDLDCPEAVIAAEHLLPHTGMVFGRPSAGASHYLYRTERPVKTERFQGSQGTIAEIRADGAQTVLPPSYHNDSGEHRVWFRNDQLREISAEELSEAVRLLVAVVELAPAFVEGQRHDLYLALSGVMKRQGYLEETMEKVVRALVSIARDNDLDDRLRACRDTYAKGEKSLTTGTPTFIKLAGEFGAAFLRRLKINPSPELSSAENAPEGFGYLIDPDRNKSGELFTDAANGGRFAKRYRDELAYVGRKTWLRFDGVRWIETSHEKVKEYAQRVAHGLVHELPDSDPRVSDLRRWSVTSLSNSRLDAMVENAMPHLERYRSEFDSKDKTALLINFRNGTFDVAKGLLREHRPEDRLTKLIEHNYVPKAECPKFTTFLNETFQNDQRLIDYVLTILAYGLTGSTKEQKIFFFYGEGGNGKSTLTDLVKSLFGKYAGAVDPAVIMEKQFQNNGPTPDVARLAGLRLGVVSEGEENQKIASGLIKRLTGDATMTARFNYQNTFEFEPQIKLIYQTNHMPKIDCTDEAMWRRIVMVPFRNRVSEEQLNGNLPTELEAEAEGVLALLVRHARNWHLDGFPKCDAVSRFSEGTRKELDTIEHFIRDRLEMASGEKTPLSRMYQEYEAYCRQEGLVALSKSRFNEAFAGKGFQRIKSGVEMWKDLTVRPSTPFEP